MLLCLLTILHAYAQLANAESKCLLSGGMKGTPMVGDSMIFCHDIYIYGHAKDYFHPIRPLV